MKGCLWLAGLFVVGVVVMIALMEFGQRASAPNPDRETITMSGEAVLSPRAARESFGARCTESGTLFITADTSDVMTVEIPRATRRADGSCAFAFSGKVVLADTYTFRIGDLEDITQQRSLIDTVDRSGATQLQVRLEW